MPTPPLTDDELGTLRAAMIAAGYTVDGVARAVSPMAEGALRRGERVPALRDLAGDPGPLATLVRLFLLGTEEPAGPVAAALGDLPLDRAVGTGLLAAAGPDAVTAGLDVRPYGDPGLPWYVVSDVGTGPGQAHRALRADHVLGVGGASVTLAHATVRRPVQAALDVGTGCGVQALHLSTHAARVVATDRNPRALALARMTALLSDAGPWELVEGDLLDPVRDRRFDLVVANPPFVVGPSARFAYRDSGLPGDEVSRRLVADVPGLLADDGVAVLLANWLHVPGVPWTERVTGWLDGTGCDALVVQRELQDPAEYAELWLRDSGERALPDYERRYADWLAWFEAAGVAAVGFGLVVLRRTDGEPVVRVEHLPQPVDPPLGPVFDGWLARVDRLRDADLLAVRFRVADGVRLEQRSVAGAGGWGVVEQALVQTGGLRLRGGIDDFGAALVAGCDGSLPLGLLVDLLAAGYGLDRDEVEPGVVAAVRDLAEQGFLVG